MTLIIIIVTYLIGYALSVLLGRKYGKTIKKDLNMGVFRFIFFLSIFSWVSVFCLLLALVIEGLDNNKPAPKWFR